MQRHCWLILWMVLITGIATACGDDGVPSTISSGEPTTDASDTAADSAPSTSGSSQSGLPRALTVTVQLDAINPHTGNPWDNSFGNSEPDPYIVFAGDSLEDEGCTDTVGCTFSIITPKDPPYLIEVRESDSFNDDDSAGSTVCDIEAGPCRTDNGATVWIESN